MLRCDELRAGYGPVVALHGISLTVSQGEIVTLIGANGAGKSTTLKAITGLVAPTGGRITLGPDRIDGLPPETVARRGVALVPEGRRIFPGLTVQENLAVGTAAWDARRAERAAEMEKVFALFPRLAERRRQLGWSLSGGEQQMLAIGRALMSRPKLLLLDEPSLGLAPIIVEEVFRRIETVNRAGMTILLVEQNAAMALRAAHRGYVIERGRVVTEGPAARLIADPEVVAAYLGA
jgi:branched-chain amino acid transport system ATP-binding protein